MSRVSTAEQLRRRRAINLVWRKYPDLLSGLTSKQLSALDRFYGFRCQPDPTCIVEAMHAAVEREASLSNCAGRAYLNLLDELIRRKEEIRAAGLWELEGHPLVTRTEASKSERALRKVARALIELAKERELENAPPGGVIDKVHRSGRNGRMYRCSAE